MSAYSYRACIYHDAGISGRPGKGLSQRNSAGLPLKTGRILSCYGSLKKKKFHLRRQERSHQRGFQGGKPRTDG